MKNNILSVYEVTDYKTGKRERVFVRGDSQPAIKLLRSDYPRFTKFVLEGHEINGNFFRLKTGR